MKNTLIVCLPLVLYLMSCKEDNSTAENNNPDVGNQEFAAVVSVSVSGEENTYSFSVGIKSPDTGCNLYADWWEVISEEGELLYRRILAHSHVNEQPFVRSGGPVAITKNQTVYVRAHMNTNGYGNKVYRGSVAEGFTENILDVAFAGQVALMQPLPEDCAF